MLPSADGTIDFDEFKAVIQAMMAKRKQMSEEMLGTGKWEHDESGFTRIFGMGGSFGENSIMYSMPLAAEMVAMGKTEASPSAPCLMGVGVYTYAAFI